MRKGIISDIQRASFHDGKGIRTTVFLKGCPLHCAWCHNPECIGFEPEIMYYPENCIGCGMCEHGCYAGARVLCGRELTVDALLKELLLDKAYYGEGGGVTFSGGEPMAQKDFLKEIIIQCREHEISSAMETSLIYYDSDIFKMLDFIMADFKIWDAEIHRQYTGVTNERIKEHLIKLNSVGVPIIVRTPVIPDIQQGIPEIYEFVKKLKNVKEYELLPYHPLGVSKAAALGIEQEKYTIPAKEYMKELKKYAFIR